jgi:hypothetical protein
LTAGAKVVPLDHHRRAEGGPAPEYETEQRPRYLIRGAGKPELIPKQPNAVAATHNGFTDVHGRPPSPDVLAELLRLQDEEKRQKENAILDLQLLARTA